LPFSRQTAHLPLSLSLSQTHDPPKKTKPETEPDISPQGPGKKWESTPLTANGKPVFKSVHVKTGDTVQVIAGSDKGKVGVISKVLLKTGQVVVEGVNVKVGRKRGRVLEFSFLFFSFFLFPLSNPCLSHAPNLAQNLPPSRQQNNINK